MRSVGVFQNIPLKFYSQKYLPYLLPTKQPYPQSKMKKIKTILTLALAFGFMASVTFTSCGGKKEEAATEQTESQHPAEGGSEHPSEGGSEHPTEGGGEHPASDSTSN